MSNLFNNSTAVLIVALIALSAMVVGSSLDTPSQAKFATFCMDYDTINTQFTVKVMEMYMNEATKEDGMDDYGQIREKLAGGKKDGEFVTFTNATFTTLGITPPSYSKAEDWKVEIETGKLVYSGFKHDGKLYTTPQNYTEI